MSKVGKYLLLIILLYSTTQLRAQEISGNYLGGALNFGIPLPHHETISYSLNSKSYGLELNYTLKTNNENYWDVLYRKPKIGFGYYLGNFGGNEVFGYNHALYSFIEASIFKFKKYELDYGVHVGLSYLPKKYDPIENLKNIAIGSHINLFFRFNLINNFQVSDKIVLFQNLAIMHVSNGNVVSPNLGLNQFTLSAGVKYLIRSNPETFDIVNPQYPSKIYLDLFVGMGVKGLKHYIEGSFMGYTTSASILYRTSMKRSFGFGIDYFYDSSINELEKLYLIEDIDTSDLNRIGIHFQHDIRYRQLAIMMQLGYYVYNKHKKIDQPVYQQYGLKYSFVKNVYAMVSVKVYYGKADYVNWGIGVNF